MAHRNQIRRFWFSACLLAAVIAVPGWLTWNRLRQLQRDNALVQAVVQNDTPAALQLLAQGANPNMRQVAQSAPPTLLQAFRLMLRLDRLSEKEGLPVLLLAAQQGNDTMMRALAAKGANVNVADDEGGTPLMRAISKHNDKATVQMLLEKGANVNAGKTDGKTALMCAAAKGDTSLLALLLEKGAKVNAVMQDGQTALIKVSRLSHSGDGVRLLLERGADPKAATQTGETAFINVVISKDMALTRLLLARGAEINAYDRTYNNAATALMYALENRDYVMVRFLLAHGADPNIGAKFQSCLGITVKQGDEETTKLLLARGANPDENSSFAIPLMCAAALKGNERFKMMRLLLAHGAHINNGRPKWGQTTLVDAASNGDLPLMRFLLAHGANTEEGNNRERTPLLTAAVAGRTQAIKLLLAYGANLRHEDEQGHNATDLAYHNGHIETARYLYRRGLRATNRFFDGND